MLPIGDHFTMSPREAAYALQLLQPDAIIPMHLGTFPALGGTVAQLRQALGTASAIELLEMKPGQTIGG